MTAKQIIKIISLGASVELDARCVSFIDLKAMAEAAKESGAHITLRRAALVFSTEGLIEITEICPKNFTLDLTELPKDDD